VFATTFCRIADLDFWWHLRTGKLIVDEGAIPRHDVFSFTALGREYIDHEWLFQVMQYATYSVAGAAGIAFLKSAVISLTLIIVALYVIRLGVSPVAAAGLAFLSIAGGVTRMIERPELFSTLFAVLTFIAIERRRLVFLPLICLVWANVHGAATIVGLLIQAAFIAAAWLEDRAEVKPRAMALGASVVASLINPFGYRVLTVPFELTRIIGSGVVNNQEWLPPTWFKTPFYFVFLGLTVVLLLCGGWLQPAGQQRRAEARLHTWARVFVALFLGAISLRYIRNVGLFCTMAPLLVAPVVARFRREGNDALAVAGAIAVTVVATIYYPFQRGIGEASYFPDRIASFVEEKNLKGRMLNSYGFGGYLIWRLFPERLIFIDGRNEVFLPLMEKLTVARQDSRTWFRMLNELGVEYALLEYVDDLDKVVTMSKDGKATESYAPVTATRFPRSRWALVYWDDDGMIFVRRAGANASLVRDEYASVYPEGRGYQRQAIESGLVPRERVVAELQRKVAEDPASRRARALLAAIRTDSASPP
jgi:hypothetical protein